LFPKKESRGILHPKTGDWRVRCRDDVDLPRDMASDCRGRTVRRQPNSVGYGLPENCPKDGGVPTLPFTSVAGRGSTRSSSRTGNAFFAVAISFALTPVRCLRRALGKEGIMHATLSPSWKKSLLLVFVSVVAFATATPATSGSECFFQG